MDTLSYRDVSDDVTITLHEPDARLQHVPEAVLQDLWRRLDFDTTRLETTSRQRVEVVAPGTLNLDGGPDFTAAHVRVDGVDWHGDVEIHRTSGEWVVHRHDEDPRYDRVVLHVSLASDRHTGRLARADGSPLPEVILLPHLTDSLRRLLFRFFAHPSPDFPCAPRWREVPAKIREPWLRLLGQERMRARLAPLIGGIPVAADLDEVLYRAVMRALGYAPNAEAMEALARRLPLRRLRQFRQRGDLEALLLGAAGLIPEPGDVPPGDAVSSARVQDLRTRFTRLPEAAAPTMRPTSWQMARLRPANTPARRIAQAAALLAPAGLLHEAPLAQLRDALHESRPLAALRRCFTSAEVDPYWRTHTRPGTRCRDSPAGIGRSRADGLIQNAALPVLLLAAQQEQDYDLEDRVVDVLRAFPAPSDRVTRRFSAHGPEPNDALEAQGLHQLFRTRCTAGRCLACTVGRWLIGK